MSAYDLLNKQLNNEMQSLAELIKSGKYTEKDRNRLASIMYPKLKYFIWKFFNDAHKLKQQYAISLDNLTKPLNIPDTSADTFEKEVYFDDLYNMTRFEINDLPDCIEKSILIDKELHHMRGNEIAEKYKMNLNTVKTKIRKARKMLKEAVLTKNPHMVDKLGEYF